jgi:hypothetical protein
VKYKDACQRMSAFGRLVTLSRFLSSPDQAWGRSPWLSNWSEMLENPKWFRDRQKFRVVTCCRSVGFGMTRRDRVSPGPSFPSGRQAPRFVMSSTRTPMVRGPR